MRTCKTVFVMLLLGFIAPALAADPSNTNVTILSTDGAGTRWLASPTHPVPVQGASGGTPMSVQNSTGTYTDRSGTIATGGVSQTLMAANATRRKFFVQNPASATENLFINFTSAASVNTIVLVPGAAYFDDENAVTTEAITVFAATTAHAYIAKEM